MSDWLAWQVVDSAFPVGVFAHSWGLEAAWQAGHVRKIEALEGFVVAAVQQTAYGAVPLLAATYRDAARWPDLDALAEAFLLNRVTNRASRIQGRTLVSTAARIWPSARMDRLAGQASACLAHVAPLSGVVFRAIGLTSETAKKVMLYGTARGVLSAAVRLGITGSYEAQRIQHEVGPWLDQMLKECRRLEPEDICQTAPVLDLLQAGHDRLYSRLFQS